jgi:hypothetical protein
MKVNQKTIDTLFSLDYSKVYLFTLNILPCTSQYSKNSSNDKNYFQIATQVIRPVFCC